MKCTLCPNNCKVDKSNSKGFCGTNGEIFISKYYLHPFEEPVISGEKGSGTVFFCGCSLKCVFCQNFELSRSMRGKVISEEELSKIFLELEKMGATNINLVNPTHYSDKIIQALKIYKPKVPIVYNTHGYENENVIDLLDEYVDVYMPDLKFYSPFVSKRYANKENYFEVASKAIKRMAKKPICFNEKNNMVSGTLVRHLVLPQNVNDSKKIIDWFVDNELHKSAYLSLMSQYTPFGELEAVPELKRKISKREYETVLDYAISKNITNLFYQELESACENYIPSWDF